MDDDGRPSPGGRGPLLSTDDVQNLRLHRTMAKDSGGILDLVVPMRVGGDGPTVFCAPPMVGLCWCYLALIPHVDAYFPLYGLQARGLRRPEPLSTSMDEIARDYADHIRRVQPAGPYAPARDVAGRQLSRSRSRRSYSAAASRSGCSSSWTRACRTSRRSRATSPG